MQQRSCSKNCGKIVLKQLFGLVYINCGYLNASHIYRKGKGGDKGTLSYSPNSSSTH